MQGAVLLMRRLCSDVSKKNLEVFRKQWKEWDNPDGVYKALHSLNPLRVKWIRSTVETTPNRVKVLDVGCGGGLLSNSLANIGYDVTAIDPVQEVIESLKAKQIEKNRFSERKAENQPTFLNSSLKELASRKFDVIVASEVIEHVPDFREFISTASKLLEGPPNGYFFITTINRTFASFIIAKYVAEYVLNIVPRGAHEWKMFVKPDEIRDEFEKHNIKLHSLTGLAYNPLRNSWTFTESLAMNYAIVGQLRG